MNPLSHEDMERNRRFERALAAWLGGLGTAEDVRELEADFRADAGFVRDFQEQVALCVELGLVSRQTSRAVRRRENGIARRLAIAASLVVLGGLLTWGAMSLWGGKQASAPAVSSAMPAAAKALAPSSSASATAGTAYFQSGAARAAGLVSQTEQSGETNMNAKSVAALAAATVLSAGASLAEAIPSAAGYVTLTNSDIISISSFNTKANWSDGQAPHAGANYLVQGGLMLRTPDEFTTGLTFGGDSLTLDNGVMNLKHDTGTVTFNDLRLYAGRIAHGRAGKKILSGLGGNVSIHGTATAPSLFSGSGSNGDRIINLSATLSGDAASVIGIILSPGDWNSRGCRFFTVITGTNTAYRGRFTVTGQSINLAADSDRALGCGDLADGTSAVTLYNQGGFFGAGGYAFTNAAYSISVTNGGTVGAYSPDASGLGLLFGNGARIAGTGTLYVNNYSGATAFDGVDIRGLSGISVVNGATRFYENYNQPALPIAVSGTVCFVVGACNALGPVTLDNGGTLSPGIGTRSIGTLGMESLTVNGSGTLVTSILTNGSGRATSDFIRVKGNLVKGLGVGKIPFLVDNCLMDVENPLSVRLLSAANLGTDITADDFSISSSIDYASNILTGTFSVETETGTNYLVFTRTSRPVVQLTGQDGLTPISYNTPGYWSNKKAPSGDYDYLVPGWMLLRARASGTFAGHSLSIVADGDFGINGVAATIPDLRLYSGGYISTRSDGTDNTLAGTGTVYAASDEPFNFVIERDGTNRTLNLKMALKGSGDIRFRGYLLTPTIPTIKSTGGNYMVTGDNSDFTGGINLYSSIITVDFADEAALGGPAPEFRADRLRFTSNAVLRCSASYSLAEPTRGITLDAGGTFEVLAGQTLTVQDSITGNGTLTKRGTGTLVLDSDNDYTGLTYIKEGTLAVRCSGAIGEGHLECETNAVLRIETTDGLTLSATDPLFSNGANTRNVNVELSAFDANPVGWTSVDAVIFRLPGAVTFNTSTIAIVNSKLSKRYKVEIETKTVDGVLIVFAHAQAAGTVITLRGAL